MGVALRVPPPRGGEAEGDTDCVAVAVGAAQGVGVGGAEREGVRLARAVAEGVQRRWGCRWGTAWA